MAKHKDIPSVVFMAQEILDMQYELERLRDENAELRDYRRKYTQLLQESIDHSGHMMCGMLELAMKPGVMQAIAKAYEVAP